MDIAQHCLDEFRLHNGSRTDSSVTTFQESVNVVHPVRDLEDRSKRDCIATRHITFYFKVLKLDDPFDTIHIFQSD